MCKKIDDRMPKDIGEGSLSNHVGIKSPWEKIMSFHDTAHYCQRYGAVLGSSLMAVYRILIPDYATRAEMMCNTAYQRLYGIQHMMNGAICDAQMTGLNVHPFMVGQFTGALTGDSGDERYLMCGRVTDFGTYRCEKELDVCYWDIVGSEVCRATTQSLQACADSFSEKRKGGKGPTMEYHMVESRGCGDLHCRIVAESREKYPMPEHARWECMGPVATADQIKFTPEEEMVKESEMMRGECDYRYISGTCKVETTKDAYPGLRQASSCMYLLPAIDACVKSGIHTEEFVNHALNAICEASGKSAYGEFYAKEGFRQFVGAPHDVNDGRLMGAHVEMVLQANMVPYEIEAFNKEEVIYRINGKVLSNNLPRQNDAYIAFWRGMTKTLVDAQWSLWEENSTEEYLRIVIGKKIDKFC